MFTFETAYDQQAVTAMARALRKTMRKKRSRRSHVFGVIVILFAVLLTLPLGDNAFVLDFKTIFTWLIAAILLFVLLFEDRINGVIARKRMLPGLEKAVVTFHPDGYCCLRDITRTRFYAHTHRFCFVDGL